MIQVCPGLIMCFFNRGNTEGTNSSKIMFGVCVCMYIYIYIFFFFACEFVSGLILQIFENLCFDDFCAE